MLRHGTIFHKKTVNKKVYYWIYILQVSNGYYYTGYTNNLIRRYKDHISGKADCKYTRSFPPVKIKQCWQVFEDKGSAMKIENLIKRKGRKVKEDLVNNPKKLKKIVFNSLVLNLKIKTYNSIKIENIVKKEN